MPSPKWVGGRPFTNSYEATKRMLLAKLEEEVPASQSDRIVMLLSNLKVIQSYANDSSTITLSQLDAALTSTVLILKSHPPSNHGCRAKMVPL